MTLKDALLAEFDMEMASTRKVLGQVPEDRLGWKPHDKSMSMARLAGHVAELPRRTGATVREESLDLMPPGAPPRQPTVVASCQELLSFFDQNVASAREALAGATDEDLMKPWTLMAGGKTLRTMPRMSALRMLVMSHGIHHRAQLGVYLRLNGVTVPGVYGPSADDRPLGG